MNLQGQSLCNFLEDLWGTFVCAIYFSGYLASALNTDEKLSKRHCVFPKIWTLALYVQKSSWIPALFFGLLVALTCDLQLGKNQKVLNIESVLLKEGQVIVIWLLWVLFNFLTLTRCLRFLLSRLVSSHLQGSKKQMSLEAQLQNLALISKYQIYVTSPKNMCFEPKYFSLQTTAECSSGVKSWAGVTKVK